MKLSRVHSRQGQSLVIVVLMLTVLLGVAGTGLTVGTVYYARTRLQNAVDAAALAGAQTYQNPGSQASLISQDDPGATGTVEWNPDIFYPNTVVATGSVEVPGGFAQIFGFHDFTVRARAVASPAPGWPFDFAIFQGTTQEALSFNGAKLDVTGGIHANQDINFNGGKDTVSGVISATGTVSPSGVGTIENNAPYIPMPVWNAPGLPSGYTTIGSSTNPVSNWPTSNELDGNTLTGNYFVYGNVSLPAGIVVDGSIEATGTITLSGGDTINGNLIGDGPNSGITDQSGNNSSSQGKSASSQPNTINGSLFTLGGGNITFDGANTTLGNSVNALILAALPSNGQPGGNITFNGSNNSNTVPGIIYAPDGTITFNGGSNTFEGSIVGNQVQFNGSNNIVQWNQSVVDSTPFGEPVLIQ